MIRQTSVAGSFYPDNQEELERYFKYFTKLYDENFSLPNIKTRAVIVPHAGYIYSGFSANVAYRLLQKSGVKKFIIIGPSHKVAFRGSSICEFERYQTPLGDIKFSKKIYNLLKEEFLSTCLPQAHFEHSTEVQFAFLKYYIYDCEIVEMVYGDENPKNIKKIIDFLLSYEDIGVIISTDLSHFYNLKKAQELDGICLEAIDKSNTELFAKGCEACGILGMRAMVDVAKEKGMKPYILDYRTSADVSKDTTSVVGYVSVAYEE